MNSTNSSSILPANCPGNELIYSFNTITLTTEIKSTWTSFNVINGVAAPMIFALNLLIIWTIVEKESLRTNKSIFLLAALAFTDLLVGFLVQPIYIWLYSCFLRDGCTVPCSFINKIAFVKRFLVLLSLTSLMMVSVERYIAVQRPFLYQNITIKKVVLSVIFNWSFLFVLSILSSLLPSHEQKILFVVVVGVLELLVTIFCTVRVQIAAYRQSREIVAQAVAVLGQATEEQKQEHKKKYQETKKTKTMCLIVFSSFVMYCPFLAMAIARGFNALGDKPFKIFAPVSITFGFLQSLVNPLISLRLSYIRRPVLRKLGKIFGFSIANEQ